MIILVKVNRTFRAGTDLREAAYRSWGCAKLLDNAPFRNQFKFLAAYCNGEIVGTFCIHGVAPDLPYPGTRRKVKFLLQETDLDCDNYLKNIIDALIAGGSQRISKTVSFCYLDIPYLNQYNAINFEHQCNCSLDEIPLLPNF
jgi:hypothetical protein